MGTDVLAWLNDVTMDIESLETREALLHWRAITTDSDEAREQLQGTQKALWEFYSRDQRFAELIPLWNEHGNRLGRDVERQLATLYSRHLIAQLDDYPIVQQIKGSSGRALMQYGLELIHRRNDGARRLGYADYYTLALAANDLDERWIRLLLETASRKTSLSPVQGMESPPSPRIGQDFVDGVAKYFDAIGLRLGGVLSRSHIGEEPFGRRSPLVFHVDKLDDVRVICPIRDTADSCQLLLHTLGVAVYPSNILNHLPYLLRRPPHVIAREASGLLFRRLMGVPEWIMEWLDFSPKEAEHLSLSVRERDEFAKYRTLLEAVRFIGFEETVYRSNSDKLERVWHERLGTLNDDERQAWIKRLALSPLYYHGRLLAEVTATALGNALELELGRHALVSSPAAGYFLVDHWYYHGARYRWDELCARSLGHVGDLLIR